LVLICLAAADYVYQKWQHEKSLRMSKEEVKEEFKQREGDPKIKSRIRKIQMEMSRRRMMEEVADADVVIVNPTSLAIALRYHGGSMTAPKVVAKGAGYIADKIKKRAYANGVPVVENRPLAQALFKVVDVGDLIPLELYQAVAEVLAYVYRLHGKTA
jgi:flagellar biosynthesis protein FlhB